MTKKELLLCFQAGIDADDIISKILEIYQKDREIDLLRFAIFLNTKGGRKSIQPEEIQEFFLDEEKRKLL
jgi:hypothetical protein